MPIIKPQTFGKLIMIGDDGKKVEVGEPVEFTLSEPATNAEPIGYKPIGPISFDATIDDPLFYHRIRRIIGIKRNRRRRMVGRAYGLLPLELRPRPNIFQ